MKKRGQFYLVAALIIVAIIISFAAISNYARTRGSTKLYNLGEELDIESGEVLTFGIVQNRDPGDTGLLEHFTNLYEQYAGENNEIYYIFGNSEGIVVYSYKDLILGEVSVDFGDGSSTLTIDARAKRDLPTEDIEVNGNTIKVTINDVVHEFELKPGDNFYYVISQELNGDVIVATG
jgi:hypothetical protein